MSSNNSVVGPVPDGWRVVTIGELCDATDGSVQTGPFGSQLHANDYKPVGTPVVMPKNLGRNEILDSDIARIGPEDVERLSRHQLEIGDIVFPRRGDISRYAHITEKHVGWLCGTGCLRIRLGEGEINSLFLAHYLGHPAVQEWIVNNAVGTTMLNLNTSIIKALPVSLPPLSEQERIAEMLQALDDKIKLNHQMSQTLGAIIRAIFKSWFIDFDPVWAKMDGEQPTGMGTETTALFPDTFVDSKLGPIPEGWRVTKLGNEIEIVKGRSYRSSELQPSTTALVTLKSIQRGGGYRPDGLKPYTGDYKPEQVVKPGELVVAYTDITQQAEVIGSPAIVRSDPKYDTLVASLDLGIVRPKTEDIGVPFLYELLRADDFQAHIYGYASGTTVLHLSRQGVPTYEFARPPTTFLEAFRRVTQPLFDRMELNETESVTLAELHNTLLPKLLSGELRVGL